MAKRLIASLVLCLILGFNIVPAFAATDCGGVDCATSPSKCHTQDGIVDKKPIKTFPSNCLFLEEPIGGKLRYDLYTASCVKGVCTYVLWDGVQIQDKKNTRGPLQAVLTREADKEYQGPFGLLYGYIGLVYNYMSGIIIGVSVLLVVVGGIQMSYGKYDEGKSRIFYALTGLVIWFAASLILYTINPTFFAF